MLGEATLCLDWPISDTYNNNIPSVIRQMGFGEGRMYADLNSTSA